MIPGTAVAPSFAPRANPAVFALGIAALGVAIFASGALALEHVWGVSLPGCGAGSACARLAASFWGKVPGTDWPVSFAGLAYFAAMLAAWVGSRGVPQAWMRLVAMAGALASAGFIGIMLGMEAKVFRPGAAPESGSSICPYCLTAHLANFVFLALLGLSPRAESGLVRAMRAPVAAIAALVIVSGVLAVVETQAQQSAQAKFKRDANASTQQIIQKAPSNAPPTGATATGPTAAVTPDSKNPPTAPTPASPSAGASAPLPPPGVFTGRYRFGPEKAAIRIVMFTDYQCPDCKLIEAQVEQVLAQYPSDLSVSIRHFPFCVDCNDQIQNANFHPNACWAARAAEAAGMIGGTPAFKKMHEWLFNRGGGFTAEELDQGLAQLGFDRNMFLPLMTGPETLARVKADIDEAVSYGLRTTPFIFINGVELKGWRAANALVNAVNGLAASKPQALGPEADRPIKARDAFVEEWLQQPAMAWPDRKKPYTQIPLQNPRPPVRVTVFGDLLEPNCADADRIIRNTVVGDMQVAYEFRYFPFDRNCNTSLPRQIIENGCLAAKAAEAAGQLGGADAYWTMHAWIIDNQKTFSLETAKAQAVKQGLSGDAFVTMANSPEVAAIIAEDISIGTRMSVQEIPRIHVNGKHVPRWKTPNGFVLERIIDKAHKPIEEPVKATPQIPQIPGVNAPIAR
jgi:protein-disulfide isomerase